MRRLALLTICIFALVPAFAVASAAGNKGVVDSSWISQTSGGTRLTNIKSAKVKKLYANFVWKKPAKAGQVLAIEWRDPAGVVRARWKDKTIKADKKGTRLYAWISSGVVKGHPGTWSALLVVGNSRVGTSKLKIGK